MKFESLNFGLFKCVLFFNEEMSNIKLIKKEKLNIMV